MTLLKKAVFLLSMFVLTQCATTSPSGAPSGGATARVGVESDTPQAQGNASLADGCPLDKMQWLYTSKQFNAAKQKELAAKIVQAAKSDAAVLDKMVADKNNNPLAISSSLKNYVEDMAQSRTPVSDEFYKEYANCRMTMCAVYDALRNGSIKKEESSKVAGNAFRDIARTFEKLKE
jgi:hypothetical protein